MATTTLARESVTLGLELPADRLGGVAVGLRLGRVRVGGGDCPNVGEEGGVGDIWKGERTVWTRGADLLHTKFPF